MSRAPPRSRLRIYFDVLRSIEKEGGRARFSHVLSESNVPYERFLAYLAELEEEYREDLRGVKDEVTQEEVPPQLTWRYYYERLKGRGPPPEGLAGVADDQ